MPLGGVGLDGNRPMALWVYHLDQADVAEVGSSTTY
jgi:hypothetical protein